MACQGLARDGRRLQRFAIALLTPPCAAASLSSSSAAAATTTGIPPPPPLPPVDAVCLLQKKVDKEESSERVDDDRLRLLSPSDDDDELDSVGRVARTLKQTMLQGGIWMLHGNNSHSLANALTRNHLDDGNHSLTAQEVSLDLGVKPDVWTSMSDFVANVNTFPIFEVGNNSSFADNAVGMHLNDKGDLPVFKSALLTNWAVLTCCVVLFSGLRLKYPEVYANNVRSREEGGCESAPYTPGTSLVGWITAGWRVTVDQAEATSGLDAAMLLEFSNFAMKVMALIGLPQILILCPLYRWCGGGRAEKLKDDLSIVDMNNVEDGSWLFWAIAAVVWYVVIGTQVLTFCAMRRFLDRRFRWLKALQPPRSTTLLVESIPERYRQDDALKEFFCRLFPGETVKEGYIVKHTERLVYLREQLQINQQFLEQVQYARQQAMSKPRLSSNANNDEEDKAFYDADMQERMEHYAGRVAMVETTVKAEQQRILETSVEPLVEGEDLLGKKAVRLSENARAVNSSSGFVTFASKRDVTIALNMRLTEDQEEFQMSIPPDPEDVVYSNLTVPPERQTLWAILGYAAIFTIFATFVPLITVVSGMTNLQSLQKTFPIVAHWIQKYPFMVTALEGVLSSLALTLFSAFLPTILMLIISRCFSLGAYGWAQQRLQVVYFWFMIIFTILVTAVGGSLLGRLKELIDTPMDAFGLLADHLPGATHFYLNFLVMQWATHGVVLTRYMQLFKYLGFRALFGKRRAVELAEPEDQHFYGIGSRSARWTATLLIGVIFSTLSPLIAGLTFVNFLVCRVFYGYLLVFAETRKPDLGGLFWVSQLRHVQFGVMIYVVLMLGVLARRANNNWPVIVTIPAGVYLLYSFYRFRVGFTCNSLPFQDLEEEAQAAAAAATGQQLFLSPTMINYRQPELSKVGCNMAPKQEPKVSTSNKNEGPSAPSTTPAKEFHLPDQEQRSKLRASKEKYTSRTQLFA